MVRGGQERTRVLRSSEVVTKTLCNFLPLLASLVWLDRAWFLLRNDAASGDLHRDEIVVLLAACRLGEHVMVLVRLFVSSNSSLRLNKVLIRDLLALRAFQDRWISERLI